MDKFTENLTEGLRKFAFAGMGAFSFTVEKSKELIDQLIARGEVTAAEGSAAREDIQKKLAAQINTFTSKLRADYENASFEHMLEKCASLTSEQKAQLIERLTAEPEKDSEPAEGSEENEVSSEEAECEASAEEASTEEASTEEASDAPDEEI